MTDAKRLAEIEARHAAYKQRYCFVEHRPENAELGSMALAHFDRADLLALVKEQAAKLAEANAGLDQFAADIVGLREELDAEAAENAELRIKLRICEDRLKLAAPVGKEVW